MKNSTHGQLLRKAPMLDLERVLILIGIFALIFFFADAAHAQASAVFDDQPLAKGLNVMIKILNGAVARAMGTLAIIGMGIAALTGRVEWSKAIVVLLGVGLIFSASALIDLLFPVGA